MQPVNKIGIGDLGAIAHHCRCNLSIKKWFGNLAGMSGKKIKILSPGVNNLLDVGSADKLPEGIKRSVGLDGGKIDNGGGLLRRDLNQLETRDEGVFPDKFRVEGESRTLMERPAERFKASTVGDVP